jgi:hypothetical protein
MGLATKKHTDHYVPRFYLNEFAAKTNRRRAPSVWLYDKENPAPRLVATSRIAKIKNLYSLEQDGSIDDSLDDALKHVESEAAPLFRSLRTEQVSFIDLKKRYIFGRFVCFLACRIPQFRRNISILFQNRMKSRFVEALNKAGGQESLLRKLDRNTGQSWTAAEFLDWFNRMKIELKPGPFQYVLLESAMRMIPPFCSMNWHFLKSDSDKYFVTSDAPVVMYNPEAPNASIRYGYLQKTIEIIFPVNKSLCLIACWTGREGYYFVNKDVVQEMNEKVGDAAERYLFSPVRCDITVC